MMDSKESTILINTFMHCIKLKIGDTLHVNI